jgi:putative tryptophan/tyrosine transport system substrate-binding protein
MRGFLWTDEPSSVRLLAASSPRRSPPRRNGWGAYPGQSIRIEYRYADGKPGRVNALATEFVRMRVDLIIARSSAVALAAKGATTTIPIVMAGSGLDPVRLGLVSNLAKPGGNVTGLTLLARELADKQLQLLKETVPRLQRVAILASTANLPREADRARYEAAGRSLGLQASVTEVGSPPELDTALEGLRRSGFGAIVVLSDSYLLEPSRDRIIAQALRHRLPAIYWLRSYVDAGGLMSYGADLIEIHRRAGGFVDRILRGGKPSEMPVEEPTKFELVINLKTAKALGLTIPPSLLQRADQVIE